MRKLATAVLMTVAVGLTMLTPARSEATAIKTYSPAERAAIKSMPITVRPYRPGHVYGNTVRLLNRIGR